VRRLALRICKRRFKLRQTISLPFPDYWCYRASLSLRQHLTAFGHCPSRRQRLAASRGRVQPLPTMPLRLFTK